MRYTTPGGRWWTGVYVDNFTDVKVRTNAGRTALSGGGFIYTSQYLAPRTFGVNFGIDF